MKSRLKELLQIVTNGTLLARTVLLALIYGGLFAVSLWVAYWLRFDFAVMPTYQNQFLVSLPYIAGIKLILLFVFGQFGSLLSYFRLPDLYRITGALSFSSLILCLCVFYSCLALTPSHSCLLLS